jgi:hypothetical protein
MTDCVGRQHLAGTSKRSGAGARNALWGCGPGADAPLDGDKILLVTFCPQQAMRNSRNSDPREGTNVTFGHAYYAGIYSHIIGDSQREAVDKVGEILRPTAPKPGVNSTRISVSRNSRNLGS